jgi:hypothetical protein
MTLFERAQPGTYADWEMQTFTSTELTNSVYEGPLADPDDDGVPNIVEFAVGGNPLVPDAGFAQLQAVPVASGEFAVEYRQRKDLADVSAVLENSSNLLNWSVLQPQSVTNVSDLGDAWLLRAIFPAQTEPGYFRVQYLWPGL